MPTLQRAIWALNPAVSFAGIETLNGLLRDTLAARRFTLTLLSGFSLVAIVLASVGLYRASIRSSRFGCNGPHVGAPEVCPEARSHAPNGALRA